jgi:hypothetical protein
MAALRGEVCAGDRCPGAGRERSGRVVAAGPVQEAVRMGQRSGVGLVELAILEALDVRRARPGGRAVSCEKVLAALEDDLAQTAAAGVGDHRHCGPALFHHRLRRDRGSGRTGRRPVRRTRPARQGHGHRRRSCPRPRGQGGHPRVPAAGLHPGSWPPGDRHRQVPALRRRRRRRPQHRQTRQGMLLARPPPVAPCLPIVTSAPMPSSTSKRGLCRAPMHALDRRSAAAWCHNGPGGGLSRGRQRGRGARRDPGEWQCPPNVMKRPV